MKVGFYQYAPVFGEVHRNLDSVLSELESIQCDLLVLPELAMTGYQFISKDEVGQLAEPIPDGPTTLGLSEFAGSHNMYIVAGLPERRGNQLFNSAVLVGPSGYLGVYRKTHLFFEETLFFSPGDTGFPGMGYWPCQSRHSRLFRLVLSGISPNLGLEGSRYPLSPF